MFLLPHVFPRLPYPGPMNDSVLGSIPPFSWAVWLYTSWYIDANERLVSWHKRKLLAIDHRYAFRQKLDALDRERISARERGIGPRDPRYPVIADIPEDR